MSFYQISNCSMTQKRWQESPLDLWAPWRKDTGSYIFQSWYLEQWLVLNRDFQKVNWGSLSIYPSILPSFHFPIYPSHIHQSIHYPSVQSIIYSSSIHPSIHFSIIHLFTINLSIHHLLFTIISSIPLHPFFIHPPSFFCSSPIHPPSFYPSILHPSISHSFIIQSIYPSPFHLSFIHPPSFCYSPSIHPPSIYPSILHPSTIILLFTTHPSSIHPSIHPPFIQPSSIHPSIHSSPIHS
jgi:hypothetical protein